jgi:tripartite-type tricarboxylate transporter receptor subunit TctC
MRISCIKTLACVAASACLGFMAGAAQAQSAYPSKPIRFVVPYATGGSTTNVARLIGQRLSESMGQPVIIDNVPGANTMIGTEVVAKAPADGYTILLGVSSHVLIPLLVAAPYDAIKDFTPIASVGATETVMVLYPGLPANNLREFIALAKSKPGALNYSTGGAGSATHLASELFNGMAGVNIRHIPYKGAAPALVDLAGGQVEMSFAIPGSAISLIKGGKLKAIAVTGEKRLSALPDVPTFTEAGLPGFEMKQWYGVLAPANLPKDIASRLATELARMAATADFKEKLALQGMDSYVVTTDQLGAVMRAETGKFAKIIKDANIKVEQ